MATRIDLDGAGTAHGSTLASRAWDSAFICLHPTRRDLGRAQEALGGGGSDCRCFRDDCQMIIYYLGHVALPAGGQFRAIDEEKIPRLEYS